MEAFIWIAVLAVFFAQLGVVAVIIQRYRRRTASLSVRQLRDDEPPVQNDQRSSGRYFFEKEKKTPPLFRFYGEILQFGINVFSTKAFLCDLEELSVLMDDIDPAKGSFFMVITDERRSRTLQFQCDRADSIEVAVSSKDLGSCYTGNLVFAGDMKHFMLDYFKDNDVVSRYLLKQGEI